MVRSCPSGWQGPHGIHVWCAGYTCGGGGFCKLRSPPFSVSTFCREARGPLGCSLTGHWPAVPLARRDGSIGSDPTGRAIASAPGDHCRPAPRSGHPGRRDRPLASSRARPHDAGLRRAGVSRRPRGTMPRCRVDAHRAEKRPCATPRARSLRRGAGSPERDAGAAGQDAGGSAGGPSRPAPARARGERAFPSPNAPAPVLTRLRARPSRRRSAIPRRSRAAPTGANW